MKVAKWITVGIIYSIIYISPVAADEVELLRQEIRQLRNDYESRIQALEGKIEQLTQKKEKDQQEFVQRLEQVEEKATGNQWSAEYVGRQKAPAGEGGVLIESPSGQVKVTLGGYFDMEYRDFENTDSTFRQHRWIINVAAQPHERLRFNSELELEYGGPNAPGGDGEAKVEQAYVDFLVKDPVNLRAGAVLVPFGRYNLYHDSFLQELTDRPLVARDIVPTTWTEAGYGFFGEFNPVIGDYEDLLIDYEIYAVNGFKDGFSDTGMRDARNSLKTDNNNNKAVVGRVMVSPLLNQEFGISGYGGDYNKSGQSIRGVAFDYAGQWGPFGLISEYAYFDIDEDPAGSGDTSNFLQGAYAEIHYRFWPEFLNRTFLGSKFENPRLTLAGRYDWALIDDDSDADTGSNEETRVTLGLNYRPIDNFVMKFEYQINETENEKLEAGDNNGFVTSVAIGF